MCECRGSSACHTTSSAVAQTLDELEFERGLWHAAQYGDLDRAVHLLSKGHEVDKTDGAGYTALHYAARNGHLRVCQLLVERGACVDAVTCQGRATALHRAATTGHYDVVEYLLSKKANCLLRDADGKNALHRAAQNQHVQVCKLLLDREPSLKDDIDDRNNKPIMYAKIAELSSLLK